MLFVNNLLPIFIIDFDNGLLGFVTDTILFYSVGAGILAGSAAAFAIARSVFEEVDRMRVNAE